MSELRKPDDSLSATMPSLHWDRAGPEPLPELDGFPDTHRFAQHAETPPLDLDLTGHPDLDLDLNFCDPTTPGLLDEPAATPTVPMVPLRPLSTPAPASRLKVADAGLSVDWGTPAKRQPSGGFSVDSGQTFAGTSGFPWQDRRVLLVSADAEERVYFRARLALANLVWVDEAATTTQAQAAMAAHRYIMAVFNVDVPVVDGLGLAKHFQQTHSEAVCVVTGVRAPKAGPLGLLGRWQQWRLEKELSSIGVEWLEKPLLPKKLALLAARVKSLRRSKKASAEIPQSYHP